MHVCMYIYTYIYRYASRYAGIPVVHGSQTFESSLCLADNDFRIPINVGFERFQGILAVAVQGSSSICMEAWTRLSDKPARQNERSLALGLSAVATA